MHAFFSKAIDNITSYGDTDIFPFPIENLIFREKKKEVTDLLQQAYSDFDNFFTQHPPNNISCLAPVSYFGFRWATQLDPFWNAYLLGITLAICSQIEEARISTKDEIVFSYRILDDKKKPEIFVKEIGWRPFMDKSKELAEKHKYVLICDIADCYQRIYHHRLENALDAIKADTTIKKQTMAILSNFSNTTSYGLPIGGPAARILVELVLNFCDQMLASLGVKFCRFADDFHIFCDSQEQAYELLMYLSQFLLKNDGLSLQKSKTRIMSAEEFLSMPNISSPPTDGEEAKEEIEFLSLSLKYDPYSPNADEEYEQLKAELNKFDIIGMLSREVAKSKVHEALSRQLIKSIKLLDPQIQNDAIATLMQNINVLYPLFPIIGATIKSVFSDLDKKTQSLVTKTIREGINNKSHVFNLELHQAYAVRILACALDVENRSTLIKLYEQSQSKLVKKDIILLLASEGNHFWLNNVKNEYEAMSSWGRRAFIIASYFLGDAGAHWRNHWKNKFNIIEICIRDWTSEQKQKKDWSVPL